MPDQATTEHLLRRTEYVARPGRVAELMPLALDAAVDNILAVPGPVALPTYLDHNIDGEAWNQYVAATQWWFDRMAFDSPRPVQEKMAFFWHGHFTSEWSKVYNTWAMMRQNKLYRDSALGNFRTLAQAMAIEPAMLDYLDNRSNYRNSPNQNFARELLELFLLGVGNYTEADVEAAAAAWTGHTIDDDGNYWFRADRHNSGNKTFFGTTKNWNGPDIIAEVLTGAKKHIAANFVVGKLWDYFAAPNTRPTALTAIASEFASTWDVKAALRAILLREEFYSTAVRNGLVRTPVDWVVAVMVQTGYRAGLVNPQWYMEGMGQIPFNPPNVSGWRPNAAWINASAMGSRADFARNVTWRLRNANLAENANRPAEVGKDFGLITKRSIPQAIADMVSFFGLGALSSSSTAAFTSYLTTQRAAARTDYSGWWEPTNLLTMSMLAPEMHLA